MTELKAECVCGNCHVEERWVSYRGYLDGDNLNLLIPNCCTGERIATALEVLERREPMLAAGYRLRDEHLCCALVRAQRVLNPDKSKRDLIAQHTIIEFAAKRFIVSRRAVFADVGIGECCHCCNHYFDWDIHIRYQVTPAAHFLPIALCGEKCIQQTTQSNWEVWQLCLTQRKLLNLSKRMLNALTKYNRNPSVQNRDLLQLLREEYRQVLTSPSS